MMALFLTYIVFGSYQLFKMKWRNHVNIPLHSFDDGTSRWLWLGAVLKWVFDILTTPFMIIFWLFLPVKQRKRKPFPKLIHDSEAFTNLCIEPGIVIFLAVELTSVASFYFFLSGIALFLHAYWKEMAIKSKIFDFQDSRIEAEMMKELRSAGELSEKIEATATAKIRRQKNAPKERYSKPPPIYYPKLSVIIEEINNEKRGKPNQLF